MIIFFSEQFAEDTKAIFEFQAQRRLFPYPEFMWQMSSKYKYEVACVEAVKRWDKACIEVIDFKRKRVRERLAATGNTGADAKQQQRPAMIDALLLKQEEGSPDALTPEELLSNVKVVYLAGSETTATAVTWIPYIFQKNPEVQANIRAEMQTFMSNHGAQTLRDLIDIIDVDNIATGLLYCHAFTKELLRLYGSVSAIVLTLEQDIPSLTLSNGLVIQAKDVIRTNHEVVHQLNEQAYPDPLHFKPERWLTSDIQQLKLMEENYFPFGYGSRICPGMSLALQEIIVSAALLGYALDFTVACPEEEIFRVMNFSASANKMPIRVKAAATLST